MRLNYAQIFSQNVLRILEYQNKNLNWLVQVTGVTISPIYAIKSEDYNPTMRTMEKIAEALNVPLPLLFVSENEENENLPKGYSLFCGILPKYEIFTVKKWALKAEELRKYKKTENT